MTSSATTKMFKFDFVQDDDDKDGQTRTFQHEKKKAGEPVLTEISLIELVRTLRLSLSEGAKLILSTVGQFTFPRFLLSTADTAVEGPPRIFSLSARPL